MIAAIRRNLSALPFLVISLLFALFVGATAFRGVAYATAQVAPSDDASLLDLLRPVYEAFANHQFSLAGCLAIVLLVALAKRYGGSRIPWFHTDAGGSLLVLLGGAATTAAAGLATPGATITLSLLKAAVIAGIMAAGGYAVVKNLLIEPLLKPLASKAPAWMQPLFATVFWIFDHTPSPTEKANTAGAAAVAAHPGAGAASVVGDSVDVK